MLLHAAGHASSRVGYRQADIPPRVRLIWMHGVDELAGVIEKTGGDGDVALTFHEGLRRVGEQVADESPEEVLVSLYQW